MSIILASASPRRTEILELAHIKHIVIPSSCEEIIDETLTPAETVQSLAIQKALDIYKQYPNDIVIGADTIVVIDNQILGKPKNEEEAIAMLSKLSNRTHKVITGVAIYSKDEKIVFAEETLVTFKELTKENILEYIHSENVYDKAGAYAIQGMSCRYIEKIDGDYYNVMGLPISSVYEKLKNIIS